MGCESEVPTASGEDLLPVDVRTVELRLPFDAFASEHRILGGFGAASDLGFGVVARGFEDVLDAHSLVRFGDPPEAVTVVDDGETAVDSSLAFVGGRVVLRVDTTDALLPGDGPVTIALRRPPAAWDERTATWELASDTVGGGAVAWPEPGAGPAEPVATGELAAGEADTVSFALDSAAIAPLVDTTAAGPGLRVSVETPGARVRISTFLLRLDVRPASKPDTTLVRSVGATDLTVVYDPPPDPAPEVLPVGGVPGRRVFFRLGLPAVVGPDDPYAPPGLGEELELTPDRVTLAELLVETRPVPRAFRALDSLRLTLRPVLAPERLPKSPLGREVDRPPAPIAPDAFLDGAPAEVRFTTTRFVRDLLRGETLLGEEAPQTFVLVDRFEPSDLGYAAFAGPGGEGAPVLRIVLTEGGGVGLP